MNIFYKLFYVLFAMSLSMAFLFPIMLLLRILLQKYQKKQMNALWGLFFLRGLFPFGITSCFCFVMPLNRRIHLLLEHFGFQVTGGMGMTEDLLTVFRKKVTVSLSFRVVSYLWVIGATFLIAVLILRGRQVKNMLRDSSLLINNIYQSDKIKGPVVSGIFRRKIYIPAEVSASETGVLLSHMELERKFLERGIRYFYIFICCIHWYNPFVWAAFFLWEQDHEMATDEKQCQAMSEKQRKEYVQKIINFKKGTDGLPINLFCHREDFFLSRARRLLFFKKCPTWKTMSFGLVFSFFLIGAYFLSFLQSSWNASTWRKTETGSTEMASASLLSGTVIVSKNVEVPSGLPQKMQLVLKSGKKTGNRYKGKFVLRMLDGYDNIVAQQDLNSVFKTLTKKKKITLSFPKKVKLQLCDYNKDGAKEVCIGRIVKKSKKDFEKTSSEYGIKESSNSKIKVGEYVLFSIDNDSINRCSDAIYQTVTGGAVAVSSQKFQTVSSIPTVLCTKVEEQKQYYVWNTKKKLYQHKNLSEEQVQSMTQTDTKNAKAGKNKAHTLSSDDTKASIQVSTNKTAQGDEEIEAVSLLQNGAIVKKFTDIQGYYCDLQWATMADGSTGRYAQLTYNGKYARTFIVYDLTENQVLYQNEDGNKILRDCLRQYQAKDVSLAKDGLTIYQLLEIVNGQEMKINFAAQTESKKNINGNYIYNWNTGHTREFTYAQMDATNSQ